MDNVTQTKCYPKELDFGIVFNWCKWKKTGQYSDSHAKLSKQG